MAEKKYCGRLIPPNHNTEQNYEGLVCVEEINPPNTFILPHYIAKLKTYSEKDCRRICRQIAEIIKISHDNGMAHRNIHMNNWLLDRTVCTPLKRVTGRCQDVRSLFQSLTPTLAFCVDHCVLTMNREM